MAAYLAKRPADLPGTCPFVSLIECPYQITCRWASTHKNPDDLTRDHLFPYLGIKVVAGMLYPCSDPAL